jgi:energy-converting hydrogenase Eha subunit A
MIIPSLILLSVTLLGGLLFVLLGQRGMDNLGLFLSFGGAFIIGMCFLHLVPEAYGIRGDAGVFVLVGFLVQGLLEYLSQGIEHGHIHRHTHDERCGHEFTWGRLPWAALISLGLHSALESMPVLNHAHHDLDHVHAHGMFSLEVLDWGLLTGLMLHKLPVAMVLMAMMLEQHVPKRTAWTILALFGLTPLLGMGVFEAVIHRLEGVDLPTVSAAIQALVVGILLHIGTTVLFEAEEGHRFHGGKFVATCVGLALSVAAFL